MAAILERLKDARGKTYWRCLEELAECEGFEKLLQQRFDTRLPTLSNPVSRRRFLMVMAASLGLAGLGGCNPQRPQEEIVPYVRQPEELVPGIPMFFATAMPLSGFAIGQLLESHEGRPTKVEGNELHPASLGASDPYAQASILTLYNPNRASTITYLDRVQSSDAFTGAMQAMLQQHRKTRGRGLRVLTESLSSPTFGRQMAALQEILPEMKWHVYEPAGNDTARQGSLLAFGRDVHTLYRFAEAQVVLSLDADFFASGPAHIRYARDFMARRQAALRKPGEKGPEMNRLYMVEAMFTPTGVKADHRWAMRAGEVEAFARAVAAGVDEKLRDALGQVQPAIPEPALKALVRDLVTHRGQSIVIPGREQPATVHALAHAMNHALGNVGKTVIHTEPIELRPVNQTESLRELIGAMAGGEVETLLILGGNPAYSAPADLDFTKAMLAQDAQGRDLVPLRVHLSLFRNETSRLCHWFLPETHYLESWSDARAFDGTASIIQPLIAPLYGGQSAHDLLASLVPSGGRTDYEAVRATWRASWEQRKIGDNFEAFWREAVHNGVVEGTAAKPIEVSLQEGWTKRAGSVAQEGRGERLGTRLPAGPHGLRRSVCRKRLAPGVAQAADRAHLGQRGDPQPGDRGEAGDLQSPGLARRRARGGAHRHGPTALPRPGPPHPGVDPRRPRRRFRHRPPGLRPPRGRERGHGGRSQRLSAANQRRAVERPGAGDP